MKLSSLTARLTSLLAAFVLVGGFWATSAQATVHALSGNGRVQIGNGLPIPITATPAPNGRILPIVGAQARQGHEASPKRLVIGTGQLTAPGNPVNLGVFLANSAVYQVKTAVTIAMPGNEVQFNAGGRTGASTYTYCASNPGCSGPADPGNGIHGLMRYTKTANQFGGPAQAAAGGSADVAFNAGAGAPCAACTVLFALATPAPTGAQGGAFGFVNNTPGAFPTNGGIIGNVTGGGVVTSVILTGIHPGLINAATSYGGPYTTGMLTVSVTANVGTVPEIFMLSGSDGRVSGVGSISLVAGSVSARTLSGPNANRGWLNLTLGPAIPSTPTMSNHGIAAFVGLVALAGGYLLHRRMSA
jgi:hypothetical protein